MPEAELRERLITEARAQGKPYGLWFSDIQGGYTITDRSGPQAFKVLPLMVHSFDEGVPFPDAIFAADDIKQGCRRLLSALQQTQLYTDNTIQPSRPVVVLRGLLIAAVLALVLLVGVTYIF